MGVIQRMSRFQLFLFVLSIIYAVFLLMNLLWWLFGDEVFVARGFLIFPLLGFIYFYYLHWEKRVCLWLAKIFKRVPDMTLDLNRSECRDVLIDLSIENSVHNKLIDLIIQQTSINKLLENETIHRRISDIKGMIFLEPGKVQKFFQRLLRQSISQNSDTKVWVEKLKQLEKSQTEVLAKLKSMEKQINNSIKLNAAEELDKHIQELQNLASGIKEANI